MNKKVLAIIGAGEGALPIINKAKEIAELQSIIDRKTQTSAQQATAEEATPQAEEQQTANETANGLIVYSPEHEDEDIFYSFHEFKIIGD